LAQARSDQADANVPAELRVRTLAASGTTLYLAGDYDQAAPLLASAVAMARRELESNNVLRSDALDALADLDVQLGKYAEAESLAREALTADRKRGPDQDVVLARTLDTLGAIYFFGGNYGAAEAPMREALEIHKRTSGMRHSLTALSMNSLASLLFQSGRYEEADHLYREVLPIYREVYGNEHPEIAVLLNNIGGSFLMAGQVHEAEPMLRQALAMGEKFKGPTNDDLVAPLNRLAMIDGYLGHFAAARLEISRAEEIARLPNQGVLLDQVLLNAADLSLRGGDGSEAAAKLAESRKLLEVSFALAQHPMEAWRYAIWDSVSAELKAHQSDATEGRVLLREAMPVIAKRFGPTGFYVLLAEQRLNYIEGESLKR
jgi:tetratricopeptide (TPR) repeat protein